VSFGKRLEFDEFRTDFCFLGEMVSRVTAKVYLVDDDSSIRTAMGRLIASAGYDYECHAGAEQFLREFDPAAPGCVILDLALPDMDGLAIQQWLSSIARNHPVIFLTGRGDISASVQAMKSGAVDFLTKPVKADILLDAIASAVARDQQARSSQDTRSSVASRIATLTPREREILDQVVEGLLNKQIAHALGIAEKTVKVHRGRIMKKMAVRTVADLVRRIVKFQS
jgi:FixJ family two-component response regulator